jgi:hypothetical protein
MEQTRSMPPAYELRAFNGDYLKNGLIRAINIGIKNISPLLRTQ